MASESVELLFKFASQGDAELAKLSNDIDVISKRIGISSGELRVFETALGGAAKAGLTLDESLKLLSKTGGTTTPKMAELAGGLIAVEAASVAGASGVRKFSDELTGHSVPAMAAASAALRTLEGQMSLRTAERFIAGFQGFSPILQAAFPILGAATFVEYAIQGADAVAKLYGEYDPLLKAQAATTKAMQEQDKLFDSLVTKAKRLADEAIRRTQGESALLGRQISQSSESVDADRRNIDRIEREIGARQRVIQQRGTGASRGDSGDPEVAANEQKQLQADLLTARASLKTHLEEEESQRAQLAKTNLDSAREVADKIAAIDKQILAAKDRALAVLDRSELGKGPLAEIEIANRAAQRRLTEQLSSVDEAQRSNSQLGPDGSRIGNSNYDRERAALFGASAVEIAARGDEARAALQAELDKTNELILKGYDDLHSEVELSEDREHQRMVGLVVKNFLDQAKAVAKARKEQDDLNRLDDQASEAGLIRGLRKAGSLADLAIPVGSRNSAQAAANNAYAERLAIAGQIRDIENARIESMDAGHDRDMEAARARLKYAQETGQAEIDYEVKVAEIRRKSLDDARNASGQLFDALTNGSLDQLVKRFALSQGRAIFQNLTEGAFASIGGSLKGAVSPSSPYASLLKGTLLEPGGGVGNPALASNTLSTDRNTLSIERLTASMTGGAGGLANVFSGVSSNPLIFSNNGNPISNLPLTDSGLRLDGNNQPGWAVPNQPSTFARSVGIAGAAFGGAAGVYAGVKEGGARGALDAGGALSAATGGILVAAGVSGPLAPILLGVGVGLSLVKSLLGDPKKDFEDAQNKVLASRGFTGSTSQSQDFDFQNGVGTVDHNFKGQTRVLIQHNYTIQAADAQSFKDLLERNPESIAKVTGDAMRAGNPDLTIGVNTIAFGPGVG